MARKKHSAEQIVAILRQIEVELANHKSIGQACKEAGINQQTYYRWRKEYGGLKLEQARRLKELEKENGRLRRLVTELSLGGWRRHGVSQGAMLEGSQDDDQCERRRDQDEEPDRGRRYHANAGDIQSSTNDDHGQAHNYSAMIRIEPRKQAGEIQDEQ